MVFIDESGFIYDMPRTNGYYEITICCYGSNDYNPKERKNVIAAFYELLIINCSIVKDNVR